jgi:hypothetical protein
LTTPEVKASRTILASNSTEETKPPECWLRKRARSARIMAPNRRIWMSPTMV